MHGFESEQQKISEIAELETTKQDLERMATGNTKDEVAHIRTTIRLAEEAVDHGWYSLFICHKASIAAGMDLIFADLSSGF